MEFLVGIANLAPGALQSGWMLKLSAHFAQQSSNIVNIIV